MAMERGVGIGYLSFLAWMPVPELAPEHGRGSKMAARKRKGATVERRQKAAAWRCSEGVRGGGSPCAGVWGGLGSCVEGQIRGGGGGRQLCCPRCEGGLKRGRHGGGRCPVGRQSPPSRWTTTCGITGTNLVSSLSVLHIPSRAKSRFGCNQPRPTAQVAAWNSDHLLYAFIHENSKDSSRFW